MYARSLLMLYGNKRLCVCCGQDQVPSACEAMCTRGTGWVAAHAAPTARHQTGDVDGADEEALDHLSEVLLRRADSPIRLPQPAPGPADSDDGEKPAHREGAAAGRVVQGREMWQAQEYPSSPPRLDLGGCGPWQVSLLQVSEAGGGGGAVQNSSGFNWSIVL